MVSGDDIGLSFLYFAGSKAKSQLILDSGATHHITNDLLDLLDLWNPSPLSTPHRFSTAGGNDIYATH